jgi:DtxR family transcriptional regulator, Mn-dependent transcriptional regulator
MTSELHSLIGTAAQDYLKAIYKLPDERLTPSALAARLGVSAAAVTKMVKRLVELKLVRYERRQELRLTPAGEKVALEVIRHHRLLEAYLAEALGYSWDQVDAEAERLEHVISEEFENRIDQALGYPTHDPHGDPIPTRDGRIEVLHHPRLSELETGRAGVITRVADRDPALLRYLGGLGLYPKTRVEMREKAPFGGPLTVRAGGSDHALGREAADQVFVAPEGEANRP